MFVSDCKGPYLKYGDICFKNNKLREGKMDFQFALTALKEGLRVERAGWNGKGMWIKLIRIETLQAHEAMRGITHPFLAIEYPKLHPAYPHGSLVPWLASQTDILADDWSIVT
jgi:hypothetical protein